MLKLNSEYGLYEKDGRVFCDSLQIAEVFNKKHRNVLRNIESILEDDIFSRLNFEQSTYKTRGKLYPSYLLTKDGFALLVMGYTGKKAMSFKKMYIQRFNDMERALLERQSPQWQQIRTEGKKSRRMETNAIKAFVEYAESQGSKSADKYYIHFSQLANAAAGVKNRDTASMDELMNLRVAEQMINNLLLSEIAAGTEYHQAFQNVKNKVQQFTALAFASGGLLTGKAS